MYSRGSISLQQFSTFGFPEQTSYLFVLRTFGVSSTDFSS